ncbi:coiled-coil domain-containing protein 34 isoform X2 [Tiliqua scincoides]|uniref:coiled-coil domain-containing protein 34 isoform X2 n=1 Tax=Tiliqua scincoides TaxID=71010 RepID=UPI00346232B3
MPASAPPTSRRGAAPSTPPFSASSDDDGAGMSSAFCFSSPAFDRSFPGFPRGAEQDEGSAPTCRGSGIPQRIKHHSAECIADVSRRNTSPVSDNLSPWEEWFLCKEKQLRARFQARALEEVNLQMEKRQQIQEREKRRLIALEKHKEWVQRKNEEGKKERERKLSQDTAEAAAKELEKTQSKKKAKEMYQEWLKKKRMEEVQKKKEEKEKEKQREAELQEKKEKSERMFKEWLQNPRNKPRPASASFAYASGKYPGQPDGSTYPAPAFYNPIPWKPIVMPPPKEEKYVSVKKAKRPISSHAYRSSSMLFHKPKNNLYIGSLCRVQR